MTYRFSILFIATLTALVAWAKPPGATELLKYEQQYVNRTLDTSKIYALNNYQAKKYSPETGLVFAIKSYWLPADSVDAFVVPDALKVSGLEFTRVKDGVNQVLYLVHPESETYFADLVKTAEKGPAFQATATASSRTLMAWPKGKPDVVFFAKLSLNKEIGGVVRTIPKGEVARSVGVSKILEVAKEELPTTFDFLPEFFGVNPKGMDRGGMLLRALPSVYSSGRARLMPMFAVYTGTAGQSAPIVEMIKTSGLTPKDFVVERLLRPFAKQWIQLAVEDGITIEAHAQNFLIDLDRAGLPTGRFVYRDFGGFNVDLEYRRSRGLAMPSQLPTIEGETKDYHQAHHGKALQQSLETYFEGGFLFGLGETMEKLGHGELNYDGLTSLFRDEIKREFESRGVSFDVDNYDLSAAVKDARSKLGPRAPLCSSLFKVAR